MSLLIGSPIEHQKEIAKICSHLFVDEAHHSKAAKWFSFINLFEKRKVVQFTATPYRNDGKMLEGKIIYNFTLKRAQEQGYFKEIEFISIREYDKKKADRKISEMAVEKLRLDLDAGYDHILMARCENKTRASDIFKLYKQYADLNPILIHSSIKNKSNIKKSIVLKNHRIIVCVDMLGEGFDLPELKIAAFHDIRKSLPITLQFAGRFTRTSRDAKLGKASFIANLHQPNTDKEIMLLYAKESNWNSLLPSLSQNATEQQIDLKEFLTDFKKIDESIIPYQNIRPAFSAVAYVNKTNSWHPTNFTKGIKGYENYDYKFYDLNSTRKTLIIFLGKKKKVDWGSFNDIYNIEWNIFIIYWEQTKNLLFIHSSEKSSVHRELAKSIIGDSGQLIKDDIVFRAFHNLDRVMLYNVGLRKGIGKDISFQSYYGKGVQDALPTYDQKTGVKNNVFGIGFEIGEVSSIGCSRKGRIWSYSRGTLNEFVDWCDKLSLKLVDTSIDPQKVLLEKTIQIKKISKRVPSAIVAVDWHGDIYKHTENRLVFDYAGDEYDLTDIGLSVLNFEPKGDILFALDLGSNSIKIKKELGLKKNSENYYKFIADTKKKVKIKFCSKTFSDLNEFFEEYPPVFWFANGKSLQGYDLCEFNETIFNYAKDDIIAWDWKDVDLSKESEKFRNIRTDSIQYFCIEKFLKEDYDIIFNDDDSGEIADIITIKDFDEKISVELYHLKYASDGRVSNQIKNFYEVCGQAQKSLNWKYRDGKQFFDHLLHREYKKNNVGQTRLRKGTLDDLEALLSVATISKPISYNMFIVQPALSKKGASESILHLLGVTANHLKKMGGFDLKVIGSI